MAVAVAKVAVEVERVGGKFEFEPAGTMSGVPSGGEVLCAACLSC